MPKKTNRYVASIEIFELAHRVEPIDDVIVAAAGRAVNAETCAAKYDLFRAHRQPTPVVVAQFVNLPFDYLLRGGPKEPGVFEAAHGGVALKM